MIKGRIILQKNNDSALNHSVHSASLVRRETLQLDLVKRVQDADIDAYGELMHRHGRDVRIYLSAPHHEAIVAASLS